MSLPLARVVAQCFGDEDWGVLQSRDPALCSSPPPAQSSLMASPQTEEFFDLIASSQSRRLDDQRANVGNLPGLRITQNNPGHLRVEGDAQEPGDEFFNMLIKCQVPAQDGYRGDGPAVEGGTGFSCTGKGHP